MQLILARHGNTFAPGDKVVWAGATNDLPLVSEGIAQAERCARALKQLGITPAATFCSALQRTRTYAETVLKELGLTSAPTIDDRLVEIDYGAWTGLSAVEVIEQFGTEALKQWSTQSVWPTNAGWGSSEQEIIREVREFTGELVTRFHPDDTVFIVSSNGRLRYFLTLMPDELARRVKAQRFNVKTGHLCLITYREGTFSVMQWNVAPREFIPNIVHF